MITFVKSQPPRGMPVSVDIPNPETQDVMRQALEDKDLKEWSDLEALKRAQGMGTGK